VEHVRALAPHVLELGLEHLRLHQVAQNALGARPRHPLFRAAIDRAVASIEALDDATCVAPPGGVAPDARERARNHNWGWMRTIWLTGPLALTLAAHNASDAGALGRVRVLRPKTCATSRAVNDELNAAFTKYTNFPDDTPFKRGPAAAAR